MSCNCKTKISREKTETKNVRLTGILNFIIVMTAFTVLIPVIFVAVGVIIFKHFVLNKETSLSDMFSSIIKLKDKFNKGEEETTEVEEDDFDDYEVVAEKWYKPNE